MINSQSELITDNKAEEAEAVIMTASAYYARIFDRKVVQGIYQTEHVNCFCGVDNSIQITNKDRYGIQYPLCLCVECGLLYANPRMTETSFERFYKEDYRLIYSDFGDTVSRSNVGEVTPSMAKGYIERAMSEFELPAPKTVFDIGCGTGNLLAEFDCDTLGVDYDDRAIARGREVGRNIYHGGIEILEASGKKADLIILYHVLEHFTDLRRSLSRIRDLLSDNGVLYIAVPGFYTWNRDSIFQNAHTYQFTGNTLWYVLRCCGFEDLTLDENIESLWTKGDIMELSNKRPDEARHIHNFLFGEKQLLPPIRLSCKFSMKERRENLRWILSSGIPQTTDLINKHEKSQAVLICGGPSVSEYPDKIVELKKSGAILFSIERMYSWCLDHGIVPDYVVAMDASDDVIESFHRTHEDTTHLLMCQCKPEVFKLLQEQNRKLYYFLVPQKGIPMGQYFEEFGISKVSMINAAGSVSLGALSIAMTLGARDIHMFGFDCHVTSKNYADGITGVGDIKNTIEVEFNNRVFTTTPSYLVFSQHFFNLISSAKEIGMIQSIKLYGDSMVSWASKENISDMEKEEVI